MVPDLLRRWVHLNSQHLFGGISVDNPRGLLWICMDPNGFPVSDCLELRLCLAETIVFNKSGTGVQPSFWHFLWDLFSNVDRMFQQWGGSFPNALHSKPSIYRWGMSTAMLGVPGASGIGNAPPPLHPPPHLIHSLRLNEISAAFCSIL